jgi:hypothetical protein
MALRFRSASAVGASDLKLQGFFKSIINPVRNLWIGCENSGWLYTEFARYPQVSALIQNGVPHHCYSARESVDVVPYGNAGGLPSCGNVGIALRAGDCFGNDRSDGR